MGFRKPSEPVGIHPWERGDQAVKFTYWCSTGTRENLGPHNLVISCRVKVHVSGELKVKGKASLFTLDNPIKLPELFSLEVMLGPPLRGPVLQQEVINRSIRRKSAMLG